MVAGFQRMRARLQDLLSPLGTTCTILLVSVKASPEAGLDSKGEE